MSPSWSFAPGRGEIGGDGAFVAYDPGTYSVTATLAGRSASTPVTVARREVHRTAEVVGSVVRKALATTEVWVHPNGKVAYIGTALGGDRLYTLDVTDPANPRIVDSVQADTRLINDLMTDEAGKVMVVHPGRDGRPEERDRDRDPRRSAAPQGRVQFTEGVTSASTPPSSIPSRIRHPRLPDQRRHRRARHRRHQRPRAPQAGGHIEDAARGRWPVPPRRGRAGRAPVRELVARRPGHPRRRQGDQGRESHESAARLAVQYDLDSLYRQVAENSGPGFVRRTHAAWRHGRYVFVGDEVFGLEALQALFTAKSSRAYGRLHVIDVSDIERPREVAWYGPEYGGCTTYRSRRHALHRRLQRGLPAFDISASYGGISGPKGARSPTS